MVPNCQDRRVPQSCHTSARCIYFSSEINWKLGLQKDRSYRERQHLWLLGSRDAGLRPEKVTVAGTTAEGIGLGSMSVEYETRYQKTAEMVGGSKSWCARPMT